MRKITIEELIHELETFYDKYATVEIEFNDLYICDNGEWSTIKLTIDEN